MKNFLKSTKGIFISSLSFVFILIFFGALHCDAQSRTTLSQEEKDAINTLFKMNYIEVATDGWEINPDLWNMYSFNQRKNFTEKLSVYYKNYTEIGKQMSGYCYFYSMALST